MKICENPRILAGRLTFVNFYFVFLMALLVLAGMLLAASASAAATAGTALSCWIIKSTISNTVLPSPAIPVSVI